MVSNPLHCETIWYDKYKFEEAERTFHEQSARACKASEHHQQQGKSRSVLVDEIARVRQHIKTSLCSGPTANTDSSAGSCGLESRVAKLEIENKELKEVLNRLQSVVINLEARVGAGDSKQQRTSESKVVPQQDNKKVSESADQNGAEEEDDIDLFGSDEDEDDEEKERLKQERLKAYEEKKSKKPGLIAKSNVILDVKPWDDETDMKEMENRVRKIEADGLVWGASRLVPLAYGINKLQISSVVEDEKVSIDWLQETIQEENEDLVQSVDIAAFNKI